jgi:nucleotide-binding universal stress UspA family protein
MDVMLILCTTDGSPQSLHVLPHAAAFARAAGMEIALTRIYEDDGRAGDDGTREASVEAMLKDHAIAGRAIVAERGKDEDTASAIARVASEAGAAIIAMDSRGVGAMRHAIFGSTAINVLRKSPCPIFVTGPAAGPAATADPYGLAITTDGSPASRAAFVKLGPILESACMPVTVIGVYVEALADAPLTIELERREATCRAAAAMLPGCIKSSVRVARAIEFERTEHAIVRAAHDAGASAIAMGTHGRGRSLHLFLGSVALGTVERSDLPVILCGQ